MRGKQVAMKKGEDSTCKRRRSRRCERKRFCETQDTERRRNKKDVKVRGERGTWEWGAKDKWQKKSAGVGGGEGGKTRRMRRRRVTRSRRSAGLALRLQAASAALSAGHGGHSWIHRCSSLGMIWRWPPLWKRRWFITEAINQHVWPPLHTAHALNCLLGRPGYPLWATVRCNSDRYTDDTLVRVARGVDC